MEDFPAHHVWKNQRVAVWPSRNPRCPHRLAALVTRNWGEVCCRWDIQLSGYWEAPSLKVLQRTGTLHCDTGECTQRERERERVHAQLWQDCSQPVGNWTSHMIELLRFWSFLFIQFFFCVASLPLFCSFDMSLFFAEMSSTEEPVNGGSWLLQEFLLGDGVTFPHGTVLLAKCSPTSTTYLHLFASICTLLGKGHFDQPPFAYPQTACAH